MNTFSPELERAVLEALATGALPDVMWNNQDDGCDCIYQRLGFWTNPYIAETLEIRFCCFWAGWQKEHPEFLRTVPAYRDQNRNEWVTEPQPWNGEDDMPKAIWYRQLARQQGRALPEIRAEYAERDDERPRGKPRREPVLFLLKAEGEWFEVDLGSLHIEA